jgi:hypothetical protein
MNILILVIKSSKKVEKGNKFYTMFLEMINSINLPLLNRGHLETICVHPYIYHSIQWCQISDSLFLVLYF